MTNYNCRVGKIYRKIPDVLFPYISTVNSYLNNYPESLNYFCKYHGIEHYEDLVKMAIFEKSIECIRKNLWG